MMGQLFRKQGYGLALPKGSPYTDLFSGAILIMRELGEMDDLYNTWITGPCEQAMGMGDYDLI